MEVKYFNDQIKGEIYSFNKPTSAKIVRLVDLLEIYGNRLSMPYSKQIGKNLFELRVRGVQEMRIIYSFYNRKAIILHYFIKKSQKTPSNEIKTALARLYKLT